MGGTCVLQVLAHWLIYEDLGDSNMVAFAAHGGYTLCSFGGDMRAFPLASGLFSVICQCK